MNIAIIAWGSLIWNKGSLKIRTKWRTDGPTLPVEFARIFKRGRLTLVIHPGAKPQYTYWAISDLSDVTSARMNLQKREDCTSLDPIHFCSLTSAAPQVQPDVLSSVRKWLSARPDIAAAIWTGLTQNWQEKFETDYSIELAVGYLQQLEAQKSLETFELARHYITNAPASIQTDLRARMREKGWFDAELPNTLFEEDQR